jgi:hypothetical protein
MNCTCYPANPIYECSNKYLRVHGACLLATKIFLNMFGGKSEIVSRATEMRALFIAQSRGLGKLLAGAYCSAAV